MAEFTETENALSGAEESEEEIRHAREIDYSSEPVIEFENVEKKYYLYKSERERFKAMFTGNRGVKEHLALDGISFNIHSGESVGFIGRNGAGKSTILKLITGVSYPSAGDVTVRGKVAAMLELTAGFSPDMTGRENILMKGYLLGLTDSDIAEIEDDIIAFAELDEYIDQPVRTYSSGMKMRLGFAINISIDPDILVVDEALSVGDARFKKKCLSAIKELIESGVTVLFVSHSAKSLSDMCERAIYLNKGKIKFDGPVGEALEIYEADLEKIRAKRRAKREKRQKEKAEIFKNKKKNSEENSQ